jgi:carbon-monoxide dehydrogenase large subunit
MRVSLNVNGKPESADVEPRRLLADFLREELGLIGTKLGCETGQCGACTVLLNGDSVKSCMVLAAQAEGASVTTIEGLATNGALSPIQEAFRETHAVQNGFSTPGLVLSFCDLLRRHPDPTEPEIRSWLGGQIAGRDTGYHNVVRAACLAAAKMRGQAPPEEAASSAFGSSMLRREDPDLLRGEGKFMADLTLPGMLHVAILFSDHGHALIKGIDTSAAAAMPGVVRVFTGADLAELMPLPIVWFPMADNAENHFPPHPSGTMPGAQYVLARDRVRYVGEHVAAVVAETRQQAYDALPAIRVEYEPLPTVVDAERAIEEGAPQLHESVPKNLSTHVIHGDKAAAEKAIAEAEVVVRQRLSCQRVIHNAEETRGTMASYDPESGEFTLWTNTQIPAGNRFLISTLVMGVPYNKIRVIVPNIGGSYGSKGYLYATEPLMMFLARAVGRPVKWVDTRWGLSRSTVHARDQKSDVTIAGTRDGKITGLYCRNYSNLGAYPATNGPSPPVLLTSRSVNGSYAIPNPCCEVFTAFTNTVPVGPMRGAGRTEAMFFIERAVDLYAREIGMDPAEVRRINFVKPDQFPYATGLGWTYDSGNYEKALNRALEMIGYDDIPARKKEARARGKRMGVGIGCFVAVGGVGPSPRMGQEGMIGSVWAVTHLIVAPTGDVSATVGSQPHGQAHVTTFSQVIATELGIPVDSIEILHSDTRGGPFAQGSYGSRTFSVEGACVAMACRQVKEKARKLAAHLLKVPVDEVVYDAGKMYRVGSPEPSKTFKDIAMAAWLAWDLPPGMDPCLDVTVYFDPKDFNFPFGTHIALVEIDEQTGKVDLVRYVAVNDVGNVANPAVVDGQMHGSIALGVGQALLEAAVYDEEGHLLSEDFSTYATPKATDLPSFELDRTVTPTPLNPLGAKGAGDIGNPPAPPAVVNAVCDALSDLGVKHVEMPVTAEKVWRLLRKSP